MDALESLPSYVRTPLGDSVDVASMKLLKESYEAATDKNVIISPLGVLMLLSLYVSGAEGKNREEILQYLGNFDYKQNFDGYTQLSQKLASMDHSFLTVANKVIVSDQFTLKDQFINAARSYNSEVDSINFADSKFVADSINEWAANNTQGKIVHPISESQIDPNAATILLNIIFFQGHWHVPFNPSRTRNKKFHISRFKSVQKPMMHLLDTLYYQESEELGAKMIALPYKETNFRMIVVLPNKMNGLPKVLEKVTEKGLLEDVFRLTPSRIEVDLDIPKFEIRSNLNLNNILHKVGVSRIFREGTLGIVKEGSVAVDSVFQEAFVKVDEEGATAGAFTGYSTFLLSTARPPPPIPFKVDHPFLFAILYDDILLFTGTYTH